jgi:hypothetical protein
MDKRDRGSLRVGACCTLTGAPPIGLPSMNLPYENLAAHSSGDPERPSRASDFHSAHVQVSFPPSGTACSQSLSWVFGSCEARKSGAEVQAAVACICETRDSVTPRTGAISLMVNSS